MLKGCVVRICFLDKFCVCMCVFVEEWRWWWLSIPLKSARSVLYLANTLLQPLTSLVIISHVFSPSLTDNSRRERDSQTDRLSGSISIKTS